MALTAKELDELFVNSTTRPVPETARVYECDCGRRFRVLEHLYQCQANRHA